MRFLEPWSFVAAAGFVAPARRTASISTAAIVSVLFIAGFFLQLAGRSTDAGPLVLLLKAAVGIAGAVAGALTGIRTDANAKAAASREDVPPEFIELLLKLDPKSTD